MTNRRRTAARQIVSLLLAFAFLLALTWYADPRLAASQGSFSLYTTEQAAQKHCPKDTVVWLNLPTGVYHFKGQRWYANTKSGAFVCEQEADKAGDRATMNGQ
jgi:hypothetical protein